MPRPTTYPIKKLIGFDSELWEKVREYRFHARLNTESDAVRRLIEAGLQAGDKIPIRKTSAEPSGGSKSDAAGTDKPARARKSPAPKAAPLSKGAAAPGVARAWSAVIARLRPAAYALPQNGSEMMPQSPFATISKMGAAVLAAFVLAACALDASARLKPPGC